MTQAQQDKKNLSVIDRLIIGADRALRTITAGTQVASRATPTPTTPSGTPLSGSERSHSAGLMRVNHAGEVCAQALYQGQALTAKLPEVRKDMEDAADEEVDHLAWCEERLETLGSHTSYLNPLWYGMSFGLGAFAGLISDKVSLGFVAATEEQVCKHLQHHLQVLPEHDTESRAIVTQMLIDEEKHGHVALEAGGYDFPAPIKTGMTLLSKTMTGLAYRL